MDLFLFVLRRKYRQQVQVADLVASAAAALLHRSKLCQTTLGEILHVVLPAVHPVDRNLLLLHGLDGESSLNRPIIQQKNELQSSPRPFLVRVAWQCCVWRVS